MTPSRSLKWVTGLVLAPLLLAIAFIASSGWNWLRGPIERMATAQTGRVLAIHGDLKLHFGWPLPRLRAEAVTFANPAWAKEAQMVAADAVEITVDLAQLLRQNIVLPEVRLERPVVYLEQGGAGRKNWLLDRQQQDEGARIRIDRLTLDQGTLGYDDAAANTSIRSAIATSNAPPDDAGASAVAFSAQGRYRGMPFEARGSGGAVLAMRDERTPYPLKADVSVGHTRLKVDGTITSLLKRSAMDVQLALSGNSLEQLFPLLGIALPATRAYATEGRLRHSGNTWRYDKFSGRIGNSDIAGTMSIDTGGKRPAMEAELVSRVLDIADLGPMIGARRGSAAQATGLAADPPAKPRAGRRAPSAPHAPAPGRLLPDLPFTTDRWNSVDAEVTLKARTIRRAKDLPLEDLVTHLSLRDSVLTLDPLNFGVAGGHLYAVISLDGRTETIQARARVKASRVLVARLFPAGASSATGNGQIDGKIDLAGKGNSVARMLASANGNVALVVAGGEISKLTMEKIGLHLWEILALKITGDRLVKLRCAVADFAVKEGTMHADTLILDTEITTIVGTGSIDLAREKLDLTFNQNTKDTSPLALRSPIHVRGAFGTPEVGIDRGQAAMRALGALALSVINPALALVPLIDTGPGKDSDCGQLLRNVGASPRLAHATELE